MGQAGMGVAAAGLARLFDRGSAVVVDEARLIERFVEQNDASAFEAIVARHGPMVWNVCRHATRNHDDAEDAFQATFLIFARRAHAVGDRGRLGGWLHGVACRVAARARRDAARRPTVAGDGVAARDSGDSLQIRERSDLLHQEIDRLPARYRDPIVLCHLEGCTHDEAAARLGWPVGTVRGRLSRGRDQLRDRLIRRGLGFASAPLPFPPIPPTLLATTARAAISVAAGRPAAGVASAQAARWIEGTLTTMLTGSLKTVALATLASGLVILGGASALQVASGARQAIFAAPHAPAAEPRATRSSRPADWGGGGEGYELSRDVGVKHGGLASGSVRSTGDGSGFGTLTSWFNADKFRGKRVRMSAYVKTDAVANRSGLWMRVDGKEKTGLAFDNMQSRPIQGTTDWKEYSVVLDIPQEAEEIFFGYLLSGTGQGWVDDITFEAVDAKVPDTGMALEPTPREGEFTKSNRKTPLNADFDR